MGSAAAWGAKTAAAARTAGCAPSPPASRSALSTFYAVEAQSVGCQGDSTTCNVKAASRGGSPVSPSVPDGCVATVSSLGAGATTAAGATRRAMATVETNTDSPGPIGARGTPAARAADAALSPGTTVTGSTALTALSAVCGQFTVGQHDHSARDIETATFAGPAATARAAFLSVSSVSGSTSACTRTAEDGYTAWAPA